MTMEATPTVTPKSAAICGSNVSAERTIAWLAKLADARNTTARVGERGGAAGGGDDVDSIGGAGLCTALPARNKRQCKPMIDKTYQPSEVEGRIYAAWESAGAFKAG